MTSQVSLGYQLNKQLNVYSNKKLMDIIRKMMYDHSTLYLKVDVKLEDPTFDDDFIHVLHYNFNIIGHERADGGPLKTRNISFSYYDIDDPYKKFYDTGYYFFDDPQLLHSFMDTYKMLLLKKYILLSFIYEYRNNINYTKEESDEILNQINKVKSHLFFKIFKNVNESINPGNEDFKEFLYSFLGKSKNSLQYSSHYTKWDYTLSKEVKVEPKS